MTDDEIKEACRLARIFDEASNGTMKMSHTLSIARALLAVVAQRDALRVAADSHLEWCECDPDTGHTGTCATLRSLVAQRYEPGPGTFGASTRITAEELSTAEQRGYQRALEEVAAALDDNPHPGIDNPYSLGYYDGRLEAADEVRLIRAAPRPAGRWA